MTLRELLNELLSLTLSQAGCLVSGVLFLGLGFWEWATTDPVDTDKYSGLALLRERIRVALVPGGYLFLGLAVLVFAFL